MSKTGRPNRRRAGRERHISVRAVRRNPPDLQKLSRALIQLAMAQEEAEAEAQARAALADRRATPPKEPDV